MQDVTAASTIVIGGFETGGGWPMSADVIDRYLRLWRLKESPVASVSLPRAQINGPEPIWPELAQVHRRTYPKLNCSRFRTIG